MRIAIDFDGTLVVQDGRPYADVTTPLQLVPGALEALQALKAAGHQLLLWSGRCSRALLVDPSLDPLIRVVGLPSNYLDVWAAQQHVHVARCEQMLAFVERELHGIFDAVDDGKGGKPLVDLFIDDKALRPAPFMSGMTWAEIGQFFGNVALAGPQASG